MLKGFHKNGALLGIYARWYAGCPTGFAGRPALFIDRDGVLVEEINYLCRPEDVSLMPGAGPSIAKLNRAGFPVVIVTNQSGIGRRFYTWKDFIEVQLCIYQKLKEDGAHIDACIACPYHPDAREPYRRDGHYFRKPNPGMIVWAAGTAGINLGLSWIVGDTLADLQAGEKAGVGGLAHVMTGHGKCQRPSVIAWSKGKEIFKPFQDLSQAADAFFIIQEGMSGD
jgi:D-glycero-D-manno-heptose 1,7-bisphosphate phosphatase